MTDKNNTLPVYQADTEKLKAGWDYFMGQLQSARNTIDDPAFFPPSPSGRNLAEGYKYLAGFMHHGVERAFHEDVDFPQFRNGLSVINKSTIDNPDAIYFYAPIDGRQTYVVKATLADTTHWRGGEKLIAVPTAPQYVIFDAFSGSITGDSGTLAELMPGTRSSFGSLDSASLIVSPKGELEILLAPEKPADYAGNFICTKKLANPDKCNNEDCYADYVTGRQLFYDWDWEEPINLTILSVDHIGLHPKPLSADKVYDNLKRMGDIVRGQMHFWLSFYDKLLNCKGSYPSGENDQYFFPVNGFNKPNAASSATGGGMSSNIYAGGIFKLAEGEALYVEATYQGSPDYVSIHLGNLWGESPDYSNHQSSLNLQQMYIGEDGVQRWIIAHDNPGVQNWLDTTGLEEGYVTNRWAYSTMPDEQDWPTIKARVIKVKDVENYIPSDMPRSTAEQHRDVIALRQLHIQRRYRSF
jgi:hypothetical protein